MLIGINDLSFLYRFDNFPTALQAIEQYALLCHKIGIAAANRTYPNLEKKPFITSPRNDFGFELVEGYTIDQIVPRLQNPDLRRFFLSVLFNSRTSAPSGTTFSFDGNESYICGYITQTDGMVVSLRSHPFFENDHLDGTSNGIPYSLKNISTNEHLSLYGPSFGYRIYKPNDQKHKSTQFNFYGNSAPASPMDLSDDEAQALLNRSIQIGKRFYGKKGGHYYTFPCTQDNIYHGYRSDDLPLNIRLQIDTHFAIEML